ncbi:hypothetical protein JTE90_000154 [Oedothorax gibbosus]|uniref:Uncharacterized protein n=1 Tax=Oedothorax gibbosus TaxID=931172 RepID=A0AAV6U668_9ARAC|nr:hypothetical protein JTE90_000154 [Oedothorax gibbosus]
MTVRWWLWEHRTQRHVRLTMQGLRGCTAAEVCCWVGMAWQAGKLNCSLGTKLSKSREEVKRELRSYVEVRNIEEHSDIPRGKLPKN